MQFHRCYLRSEDQASHITIDLLLDGDQRVVDKWSYFGSWRDGDGVYPFVLMMHESSVDFGAYAGASKDRYGNLKLHDEIVELNRSFNFDMGNPQTLTKFTVIRIDDLAS